SVSGIVKEVRVKEGEKVKVGQVIFTLEGGAPPPPERRSPQPMEHVSGQQAGTEHREPVPAAPHVRRLARELGLDIYNVTGSGPSGRISEDDVKAYAKATLAAAVSAAPSPHGS